MIEPIPQAMQEAMRGVSWHEELPCPRLDALRLVRPLFIDFEGAEQRGALITSALLAESVLAIFDALHAIGFPIHSIRPMCEFDGDDGLSMAANNSSCFNARRILNSERLSLHSYGRAIDINPVQNPVIRDGHLRPDAGAPYAQREPLRPGMVAPGTAALQIFADAGWKWGGDWGNPKDYHHFYLPDPSDPS